jgi:hypothetical protein
VREDLNRRQVMHRYGDPTAAANGLTTSPPIEIFSALASAAVSVESSARYVDTGTASVAAAVRPVEDDAHA